MSQSNMQEENSVEFSSLSRHWPIPGPWQMRPLAGGTNNLIQLVETDAGRYVLRIYQNHADLKRLRYEHAVLDRVQAAKHPFQVPAPIPTRSGETIVRLPGENGEALAVLSRFLPGSTPDRENLEQTWAAGQALAELERALGMGEPPTGPDLAGPPPIGDLRGRLWLDDDPFEMLRRLPLDTETRPRLISLLQQTLDAIPRLYATLPQQLIHADYDPGNMLMEGNRVTGVLDFEFSGVDLRVMDLANALMWWPSDLLGTGKEWSVIEAFGRGYAAQLPLLPVEVEAIPAIMCLRSVGSLLHRAVRYQQGLSSQEAVLARVSYLFWREDWLRANQDELLRRALRWQTTE
jgi:homoserine kinase type II